MVVEQQSGDHCIAPLLDTHRVDSAGSPSFDAVCRFCAPVSVVLKHRVDCCAHRLVLRDSGAVCRPEPSKELWTDISILQATDVLR